MQNERELQVIQAAYTVFIRYGFARTTMGDLAKEAGLSRPALYLVYPGKAEVFEAVLGWMIDSMLGTIANTLQPDWPLAKKLMHVFEICSIKPYDEIKKHPDAQDLLSLDSQIPGIEQVPYARLQVCLEGLLAEPVAASGLEQSATEIARTLLAAVRGFKLAAQDSTDLRDLIERQVQWLAVALV
ncbi:TetR family transcriptional regulator [Silvimonas amylolytica]|uniref:TetR family transcriptional regulator n=2 Tax=Silvimonas amylolytica TaxID=449663 RepID=A0ABQ2PN38_9NEIS|nr:TetR family transcriptional regulator [Silvimonas amylolytica]